MTSKYTYIATSLAILGALLAGFAYLLIRNVPLTVTGLAFLIIGVAIFQLPVEVTGSKAMKQILEGTVLTNETLLQSLQENAPEVSLVLPDQKMDSTSQNSLTNGTVRGAAIYLPPDDKGVISVFIPTNPNATDLSISEMRNAPKYISKENRNGLLIFPPGAKISEVPELQTEQNLIEDALHLILVELAEICSYATVSEVEDIIILELGNVRVSLDPNSNCSRTLGSLPASLGACVITAVRKVPLMFVDEKLFGTRSISRFRVLIEDNRN
jgi:hypothetical protein